MAVLSFFLILCRDGTGRGCIRRGSTNQPPDHRITASLTDSGLVPTLRAGSGGPGEYCHDYFSFAYKMKISVRCSSLTTRILP